MAKAKAFTGGCFVLDASERRRLDGFETTFGIPVWYACFPPGEDRLCYLFRNRELIGQRIIHDPARQTIRVPVALGAPVHHARLRFSQALLQPPACSPATRRSAVLSTAGYPQVFHRRATATSQVHRHLDFANPAD